MAVLAEPRLLRLLQLLLLVLLKPAIAKYEEGHLVTPENWAFVARFCFLSDDGTFEYKIEYDKEYATQNLLLYYDSSRQWPAVYKTNKTCEQKEAVLNVQQNQVVNLTELRADSGCVLTTVPPLPGNDSSPAGALPALPPPGAAAGGRRAGKRGPRVVRRQILTCHNVRRFRSARERWWFLAISNCNGSKGLNVHYRFLMTNGPPGDYWHEHFSADEFYILPTLMFFSIAYLLMIIAIVMCTVELRSRQLLHATYKMFVASVALQSLGVLFQSIAYIRYALDGVGFPRTRQLGRLMEAASETMFLLLLLLLAKGFTVTRGRLRVGSSIKLTIFMCLYVVTYVSLFIYEREFFDPGEVLYLFESPAGYGLMVLRIVAWWMFVYSTVFTLKHYPEKATFYYPFNLLATLWFVAGPCFIMSANSLIDKWVRESVVYAVLHTIAFLGHLQFMVLTRPSKANKNFPFHVRTTQIAVMEVVGVAGASSLYHFGHHNYAPGGPKVPATAPMSDWMHEVPVGLFTVSRAVTELRTAPRERERALAAVSASAPASPPPRSSPAGHAAATAAAASSTAASAYRLPPSAPPASELLLSPSLAAARAPLAALPLGADMAGGDARVGDGRESSAGSSDRDRPATPEPPKDAPRDPQMFIAPSQRALSSSGSSAANVELKSRAGSATASAASARTLPALRGPGLGSGLGSGLGLAPPAEAAGGGGGLQRGPGVGAPVGLGDLDSIEAAGTATSRL